MTSGFTFVDVKTSPPRYLFPYEDSDDETQEKEAITPTQYFSSNHSPQLRLVIYFNQPYLKKKQIDVQTLALTKFAENIEKNTVTCTFKATEQAITLFSCNHEGRYSKIEIVNEDNKCLKTYSTKFIYDSPQEKKFHIYSQDCSLDMSAALLTQEEEKKGLITEEKKEIPQPNKAVKTRRVLFPKDPPSTEPFPPLPQSTPSIEIQVYDNVIRYGAVVKVDEISVTFRLETPDELIEIQPPLPNQDPLQNPQK